MTISVAVSASRPASVPLTGGHDTARPDILRQRPNLGEFERLMRDNNQRLFRIARSILKNDADAEEVVQLAYVTAYSRWDQLTKGENAPRWLNRIVCNRALDRLRESKRRCSHLADAATDEETARSARGLNPETEVLTTELRELLERLIERLPPDLSSVLVMRDVEGMSSLEVSQALGVGEGAVRVRLHRARHTLKKWLGRHLDSHLEQAYSFAGQRCDRIVSNTLEVVLKGRLSAAQGPEGEGIEEAAQAFETGAWSSRPARWSPRTHLLLLAFVGIVALLTLWLAG